MDKATDAGTSWRSRGQDPAAAAAVLLTDDPALAALEGGRFDAACWQALTPRLAAWGWVRESGQPEWCQGFGVWTVRVTLSWVERRRFVTTAVRVEHTTDPTLRGHRATLDPVSWSAGGLGRLLALFAERVPAAVARLAPLLAVRLRRDAALPADLMPGWTREVPGVGAGATWDVRFSRPLGAIGAANAGAAGNATALGSGGGTGSADGGTAVTSWSFCWRQQVVARGPLADLQAPGALSLGARPIGQSESATVERGEMLLRVEATVPGTSGNPDALFSFDPDDAADLGRAVARAADWVRTLHPALA